jgi:hypothetical protein
MRNAAQFLLAYARRDATGKLYTYPSNAHESNRDVRNPTTDVSAMRALFPALIQAAAELNVDDDVVQAAKAALPSLPELPLTEPGSSTLLAEKDRNNSNAVIANSYSFNAIVHNQENLGLEPVWPYSLIGDDGPLHALGVRTFEQRPNKAMADWSADPVQAARLGLAEEMKSTLKRITETYQFYPSGLAQLTEFPEFYVEQVGVVADALQNGLVQDYDGLIRILPAWPSDWDANGAVVVQHGNRVQLQVHQGHLLTLGIECVTSGKVRIRNPWLGHRVNWRSDQGRSELISQGADGVFSLDLKAGTTYLLHAEGENTQSLPYARISGEQASSPKRLGSRSIGLFR